MFGFFRRKPKPTPAFEPGEETRAMVVLLVAGGMSFAEILKLYPEMNQDQLSKIMKTAVKKLPMFPD